MSSVEHSIYQEASRSSAPVAQGAEPFIILGAIAGG
jgi:hypothetical protein